MADKSARKSKSAPAGAKAASAPLRSAGRFAYEGLERVLHEKARLGIATSLNAHPRGLLFTDLKELCELTDGNLNRHLKVLQDAGLVETWKRSSQKRPQTLCRLTPVGRERYLEYINVLEQVVRDAVQATQTRPRQADPSANSLLNQGWSPA